MLESFSINRFLTNNSSINTQPIVDSVEQATMKTKYRPDKICPRDQYFKWDLIFSGIDTPHKLARGGVVAIVSWTGLGLLPNLMK